MLMRPSPGMLVVFSIRATGCKYTQLHVSSDVLTDKLPLISYHGSCTEYTTRVTLGLLPSNKLRRGISVQCFILSGLIKYILISFFVVP